MRRGTYDAARGAMGPAHRERRAQAARKQCRCVRMASEWPRPSQGGAGQVGKEERHGRQGLRRRRRCQNPATRQAHPRKADLVPGDGLARAATARVSSSAPGAMPPPELTDFSGFSPNFRDAKSAQIPSWTQHAWRRKRPLSRRAESDSSRTNSHGSVDIR